MCAVLGIFLWKILSNDVIMETRDVDRLKKFLWAVCLAGLFFAVLTAFSAHRNLGVKSSLKGEVTWTVEAGTEVPEGAELVRVATLTGEIAAARAPVDGKVSELLVKPGGQIAAGTVVAKIVKNEQER